MSMSIKKSRLFKLLAVAALVVVMAIGTALPSFASSEDKKLYFQTTGNAYAFRRRKRKKIARQSIAGFKRPRKEQ